MICKQCIKQIDEDSKFCPYCGKSVEGGAKAEQKTESKNIFFLILFGVISFLFPVLGLIFFLVWEDSKPKRSKVSGICALVEVMIEVVLALACVIAMVCLVISDDFGYYFSVYSGDIDSYVESPLVITSKVTYKDTSDGVVTFTQRQGNVCYDEEKDYIITWEDSRVTAYNAQEEIVFSQTYPSQNISAVSAYGGVLCIAFGEESKIYVYDNTWSEYSVIDAQGEINQLVVTGNRIVYSCGDGWCDVYAVNLRDMEETMIGSSLSSPLLAVNCEENILYVAETDISDSDFIYINLSTFTEIYHSAEGQYGYNKDDLFFDGEYVHAFGNTYNATTGRMVASRGFVEKENKSKYGYVTTLCRNDSYAFILSENDHVAVYSLEKEKVVYTIHMDAERIYQSEDNTFVAVCGGGYTALINLNEM